MSRLIVQWLHRADRLFITINEGAGFQLASLEGTVEIRMFPGRSSFVSGSVETSFMLRDILVDAEKFSPLHASIIISLTDEGKGDRGGNVEEFLRWLRVPAVSPGGETCYPLPRLGEIRMKPGIFCHNPLRSLLALRSANVTDQVAPGVRRPDPITAVWVPTGPGSTLENVLQELFE